MSAEPGGTRCNFPTSLGQLLAVGAVPDAALLLDGPTCGYHKAELIAGNHDLASTLLSADGAHRVWTTEVDVFNIVRDRRPAVRERLTRLRDHPDTGVVLLSALPVAAVVGTPHQAVIDGLPGDPATPVAWIPTDSFDDDWLQGYAATLRVLAEHVDLEGGRPDPDRIAVVGLLVDRREGDHRGNRRVLDGMLRGLGLQPTCWPGDAPFRGGLAAVRDAGWIVSLPHGRAAARVLAERTGAALVETDLPFGLAGSRRWLEAVAAATGREAQADAWLQHELDRVIPRLERVVDPGLRHQRLAYVGEPHLAPGLAELGHELGFELAAAICTARPAHRDDLAQPERLPAAAAFQPTLDRAAQLLHDAGADEPLALVISNTHHLAVALQAGLPFLEFGFPNALTHHLVDAPFLGLEGCLGFVERLANRLALAQVRAID